MASARRDRVNLPYFEESVADRTVRDTGACRATKVKEILLKLIWEGFLLLDSKNTGNYATDRICGLSTKALQFSAEVSASLEYRSCSFRFIYYSSPPEFLPCKSTSLLVMVT
jgi:hypothetical protein